MRDKEKIGFIGVGLMGHGAAKNILEGGYPLTLLGHRNRQPVDDLVGRGAIEATSPAALVEACDIIFLCVTGTPQVEDIVYRENGLLAGMSEGKVVLDMTTAIPDSSIRVAQSIAERGGHYLDLPMIRTPKEAELGKLALIAGGDKDILDSVRPVLDTFSDTLVHCGPLGAGHRIKLINNFLALGNAVLIAEAVTAAAKGGVGLDSLFDVVCSGGADSAMFRRLLSVLRENDTSLFQFTLRNARKDVSYYTKMADGLTSTAYVGNVIHQMLMMVNNLGHGDAYVPKIIDVLAEMNGVDIAAAVRGQ